MMKRVLTALLLLPWLPGLAQTNLTGTWVAKQTTPMGDMEMVYELKVEGGKITGSVSAQFGDMPIVYSLWALLAAPLIAGNDLRAMSPETRDILLNREAIDINQDQLGKAGRRVSRDGNQEVWMRPLAGGDLAVGLFNRGETEAEITVKWADLKLAAKPVRVRDVWAHADLGSVGEGLTAKVERHGVALLRLGD